MFRRQLVEMDLRLPTTIPPNHGPTGKNQIWVSVAIIRPERARNGFAALVNAQQRLPSHLAHPLKDDRAVFIHALGSSLQGSRKNCSKPCRLFPADIPGRGSVVITTRRICTINTRAPFDLVEV